MRQTGILKLNPDKIAADKMQSDLLAAKAASSEVIDMARRIAIAEKRTIKGTIGWDARSLFIRGDKLYGGGSRLANGRYVSANASAGIVSAWSAINSWGDTRTAQGGFGLLKMNFARSFAVWRSEVTHQSPLGGDCAYQGNGSDLALFNHSSTFTTFVWPSANPAGYDLLSSAGFYEASGGTTFRDWYISCTDPANPAGAPQFGGYTLQVGDWFKLSTGDVYRYGGIHAGSGAWFADLVRDYYTKSEFDVLMAPVRTYFAAKVA